MATALRRIIISVAFWTEGKSLTEVVKGAPAEGIRSFLFWSVILAVVVRLRIVVCCGLEPVRTLLLKQCLGQNFEDNTRILRTLLYT